MTEDEEDSITLMEDFCPHGHCSSQPGECEACKNGCPWCGEDVMGLVSRTNYDSNLEAHITECQAYLAEQGVES